MSMNEATTEYLANRLEISDVIHAYAEGVDDKLLESVVDLFAPDAQLRVFDRPSGKARGREEIAALMAKLLGTFEATSHHVSNTRIQFDGTDQAKASTALYAWHRFVDGRPDGYLWARYHDAFVRIDGRWKFAERTLRVIGQQDFALPWIMSVGVDT